jgi:ABC-type glycerol-3-phosphate transport system permease component
MMEIKSIFRTKKGRSFGGNMILFITLTLFALFFLFPVVFMFNSAFKPIYELMRFPPTFFVRDPTLEHFASLGNLFNNTFVPFARYLFNSLVFLILGTAGQILFSSMAAYPLAKFEFFGEKFLNSLIILALMFSPAVTAVHSFLILSALGMIDTYWAIIIPSFASTIGLFLMRNFMQQIPNSLIEASQIDGAGEFRTFWTVVMPNVKPAIITLFIMTFQGMWGVTGGGLIFTESLKPLPAALGQIASGISIARMGEMAVVSLLMFVIPVVVFIVMQSKVVETMTTSGMKE